MYARGPIGDPLEKSRKNLKRTQKFWLTFGKASMKNSPESGSFEDQVIFLGISQEC